MSSETLLFDAGVDRATASGVHHELVARVAPDAGDVPVFPSYDLEIQFRVMQLVGEHAPTCRCPAVRWLELDPAAIGAPFFVMDRVEGRVPPDVMPYPMGSWLLEADPADQRALQDASVRRAGRHPRHRRRRRSMRRSSSSTSRATRRCAATWPTSAPTTTGCAATTVIPGDRGGVRLARGQLARRRGRHRHQLGRLPGRQHDVRRFTPVAVLDWEMAALGTRGIDVGWMIFIHDFFQDICRVLEMEGMPGFMRSEDVAAAYAEASGRARAPTWPSTRSTPRCATPS